MVVDKKCITLWKISENKGVKIMKKYSCETHIGQALDLFVAEQEDFPIMEKINEEENLSTTCEYCEALAIYIVSSK